MAISIVRLGTSRQRREGLRFGTVRRPPRGVRKEQYGAEDWFDVWLPTLSPSAALIRRTAADREGRGWRRFEREFRAELRKPDPSQLLDALAALSHVTNFSVGCYCEDERHCHRSVLRSELERRSARIK